MIALSDSMLAATARVYWTVCCCSLITVIEKDKGSLFLWMVNSLSQTDISHELGGCLNTPGKTFQGYGRKSSSNAIFSIF